MRGEPLDAAMLGWHGLEGDRRLTFRRLDESGGFPWLTGRSFPPSSSLLRSGAMARMATRCRHTS
jgi:hypothetical protein